MITGKQGVGGQGRAVGAGKRPGAVDFPTPLILELWRYADFSVSNSRGSRSRELRRPPTMLFLSCSSAQCSSARSATAVDWMVAAASRKPGEPALMVIGPLRREARTTTSARP
jgi:hypothetical protein